MFALFLGLVLPVKVDALSSGELLELTNGHRLANSSPSLAVNDSLARSAVLKADDMCKKRYWGHYGPEGSTPWQFIKQVKYNYSRAAENLAINFDSENGVINGWLNSISHRKSMLDSRFTEVGFGIKKCRVINDKSMWLVVAHYGVTKREVHRNKIIKHALSTIEIGDHNGGKLQTTNSSLVFLKFLNIVNSDELVSYAN